MTQRQPKSLESPNIAERVKFWEEQDKINQELIPRVIRQHELFTSHIADHENLPLIAGNAIGEALAEARQQQQAQHEAEMAELRTEAEERHRQHEAELQAAKAEREEQSRQHSNEVPLCKSSCAKPRPCSSALLPERLASPLSPWSWVL